MKILIFFLLFTLAGQIQAASLEIFSMNLHCALGDWKERVDVVLGEIIRREPDVIGLQEVCKNKNADMTGYILSELTRNKYPVKSWKTIETHRSFISYQEELLIVSRHEATESSAGPIPSVKFFENKFVGLKINGMWFVTTHLHFALPSVRKAQYKSLDKQFSNKETFLFGDMNSHPGNTESTPFLLSKWSHHFNGPTYPAHQPKRTFDGFWLSEGLSQKVHRASIETLFQDLENPPSDHLGVYLRVDLK